MVLPGGEECELAAALSGLPTPIAGFGNSDCDCCRSHPFQRPDAATPVIALENLESKNMHTTSSLARDGPND